MRRYDYVLSPLNYMGGKGRILRQLIPLLPEKCNTFVDLFCGGCNVGINIDADMAVYNDMNKWVIGLMRYFKETDAQDIIKGVNQNIEKYGLSRSRDYGVKYYSHGENYGTARFNKDGYNALREDYNREPTWNKLYTLIVFSFNNQIRFNSSDEYNMPVGKGDFNVDMENKLALFVNRLHNQKCEFTENSFAEFNIDMLNGENDYVYADPPYLITCATYNERNAWGEQEEKSLLDFLQLLHERGVGIGLSNVIEHEGRENTILKKWINERREDFHVYDINMNYKNCSYHKKDRKSGSHEIFITNRKCENFSGTLFEI